MKKYLALLLIFVWGFPVKATNLPLNYNSTNGMVLPAPPGLNYNLPSGTKVNGSPIASTSGTFTGTFTGQVNSGTLTGIANFSSGTLTINPHVIYVSQIPGIHQNSNVASGGGTDDTALIQAAVSASIASYGNCTLIQDGASLISGLVFSNESNLTIQCLNSSCGFYLANSSNAQMLSVNWGTATGTQTTAQTNFQLIGGTYNGNGANQSKYEGAVSTNMFNHAVLISRTSNFLVKDVTVINSRNYSFLFNQASYGRLDNIRCEQTGTITQNQDTLHFWQADHINVSNIWTNCGDDVIALNTDEALASVPTGGDNRFPTSGGAISNLSFSNVTLDGTDVTDGMVRFIGYTESGGITTVSNVSFNNITGDKQYAINFSTPCTASNITFNGWYVTSNGSPAQIYGGGGNSSSFQVSNLSMTNMLPGIAYTINNTGTVPINSTSTGAWYVYQPTANKQSQFTFQTGTVTQWATGVDLNSNSTLDYFIYNNTASSLALDINPSTNAVTLGGALSVGSIISSGTLGLSSNASTVATINGSNASNTVFNLNNTNSNIQTDLEFLNAGTTKWIVQNDSNNNSTNDFNIYNVALGKNGLNINPTTNAVTLTGTLTSVGVANTGTISNTGPIAITAVGSTYSLKGGSNAASGTVTLVGGTGTISSTAITASSVIFTSLKTAGGTETYPPNVTVSTGTAIFSANPLDTGVYNWGMILGNQ